MNVLLPLLIVAIDFDVPIEARYPEASTVFHCTFDSSWDENYDHWPDKWKRRKGPGFPHYVQIKIREEPSPVGDRCLGIDLDGGAAVAYSPPVRVGPRFSYVLEGFLKTEGLKYDRAYFSITLLDEQRHRLQTFYSEKIRQSGGWRKYRLGPVSPESDEVWWAIIGLHVEPKSREDLVGSALFDDIWLGRLPRMALKSNDAYNFFTKAKGIRITCTASGFLQQIPQVTFELENVWGENLAQLQRRMSVSMAAGSNKLSLEAFSAEPPDLIDAGRIGETTWEPPIPGPGFYRIRVTMRGQKTLIDRRELALVVIEPRRSPAGGQFGWTLPRGDKPLPLPRLSQVLGQAGINWIKYPLWYEEKGSEDLVERLMAFGERLGAQGIELIGLWHEPPGSLRARYGKSEPKKTGPLSVADLFAPSPEVWYPSLEPVMARLATQVRWWQLGHDQDTSFVDYPNRMEKIAQIKSKLDRIGQDVNLAVGWNWIHELPPAPLGVGSRSPRLDDGQATAGKLPWRAVALSADPPLTHQELASYLEASRGTELQRWVVVEPLPADAYPIEVRATDLVRRMIAAMIHGADIIFCPEPFSTDRGLMNSDGTPGELFLPWRTTGLLLGGASYLGSIELPKHSPNHLFARAEDVVMLVWNNTPTEEVIYLGEDVRQIDLWGRSVTPEKKEHRQVIRVGRLPTFVTGINEPITRWRMHFGFAQKRIPSIFGQPHRNSLRVKNCFAHGAGGRVELVTPKPWIVDAKQTSFQLAGGEELTHPFEITLPYNASSGHHDVRVDFEIQGGQPYKFSVYRQIDVGLGDVYIDLTTQLNGQGELEIEQRFVNQTDSPVSFRCQLFVPDRRRLKTRITGLSRGSDVKVYRLANGKALLGRSLWLRAEEIDGPRILNYRFAGQP